MFLTIESARLLCWLGALEDALDIGRSAAKQYSVVHAIEHQAAGRDQEPERIDRQQTIALGQRNNGFTIISRGDFRHGNETGAAFAPEFAHGRVKFGGAVNRSLDRVDLGRCGGGAERLQIVLGERRPLRIEQEAEAGDGGGDPVHHSTHLPPSEPSMSTKSVILPPDLAGLATKPLPTGSDTAANTIGKVRVCVLQGGRRRRGHCDQYELL